MNLEGPIVGAIGVVVVLILLTALAPTIHDNTATGTGSALENVSSTSKPIYNLVDLLWAALVIIVIVGFGYRAVKGKGA